MELVNGLYVPMFNLKLSAMRNVCGLDVHKDNVFVCILKENSVKIQFKCGILTKELDGLRDMLVREGVGEIAMESTSVYWSLYGVCWKVTSNFIWSILIPSSNYQAELTNLQTVPGVGEQAATQIIAEMGVDMSMFLTASMLVGWAGLKPRNDESNGKFKSRKTTHGNKYLRKTLVECAWGASRTQGCFYCKFSYHQTQVRKKPKMKVQVAIARKILVASYYILSKGETYKDYNKEKDEETLGACA